jgi:antitoxin component YwqK of YwqJK toxin-antitoxin module
MLETLFSISLFFTGGNIIDTKLNFHKYEKENFKEIFYLKTKEAVNTYCIKHSELENIKKIKYHDPNGGQKTIYKVTKSIDNETKKEYWDNGQIKSVEYYKDGKRDGIFSFYFENGQKRYEKYYKNGELIETKHY